MEWAAYLGIGGGVVMVPLLVLVFRGHGMPSEHVVHQVRPDSSPPERSSARSRACLPPASGRQSS